MGGGPDIALVLHPRRDPGRVLDAIGGWAIAHGARLLDLPFLPDELRELAT